jgi:phosphoribosyl 1,2-cyclic phosphate phosphodiesterase
VPDEARGALRGLDVLVLNALWWRPHPTHMSIREAIDTARDLGARRTFLTHLTHETGHEELADTLAEELPLVVAPAYDGQMVEVA